jgi:hypothetical protein
LLRSGINTGGDEVLAIGYFGVLEGGAGLTTPLGDFWSGQTSKLRYMGGEIRRCMSRITLWKPHIFGIGRGGLDELLFGSGNFRTFIHTFMTANGTSL